MTNDARFHLSDMPTSGLEPKHLSKQQFGRRLYQLMLEKGWNQSELARAAGIPRDSVSVYVNGKSLPTPKSLSKLADALDLKPADLLPNSMESAIDKDFPALEMRVSSSQPRMAWLRVNQLVSVDTAVRVLEIVNQDQGHEAADAR